jgi:PHD/YefM family antitoxin component YafN of YafNO toxin-antitoxin module
MAQHPKTVLVKRAGHPAGVLINKSDYDAKKDELYSADDKKPSAELDLLKVSTPAK